MATKIDVNVFGKAIGSIADSITEITKAISKYYGSSDLRRMVKCIRNSDKIVKRIGELGIDDKVLNKLIEKHDKYNN